MLYNLISLITTSTQIGGSSDGAAAPAAAPVAEGSAQAADAGLFGGSGGIIMILVYAAIIGAMWYFMVRPQKKREKEIREMQASIKSGDNVVTTSGFFGKVVSIGEDCFVIEFGTNKGVRVPVRKIDIIGIKTPNMAGVIEQDKSS